VKNRISKILSAIKRQKRIFLISALTIIAVISAIIVVYPFLPAIEYYSGNIVERPTEKSFKELPGESIKELSITESDEVLSVALDPAINQLIIPKIGVQIPIVEGEDESVLNKGAWRLPMTSTPNLGGNTVLTGHRYKYRPPHKETFYLLDKLIKGDLFQIFWQGEEYNYQVVSSIIVNPDAIEVINPTPQPTVTLITCTPLFSTKQRLIIRGELIEL
jgi:sortase A